jgi:hypothetical protein
VAGSACKLLTLLLLGPSRQMAIILQRFSMLSFHAVNVERFLFGHKMQLKCNSCGPGSVSKILAFPRCPRFPSSVFSHDQNRFDLIGRAGTIVLRSRNIEYSGVDACLGYGTKCLKWLISPDSSREAKFWKARGKLSSSPLLHDRLGVCKGPSLRRSEARDNSRLG